MPKRLRTPVLYVHHRSRARRSAGVPVVPDPRARRRAVRAAHLLPARARRRSSSARPARACTPGPVAGFTHIWASTYRGRRWLLFARELALLPQHVLRFRRTLRRNQFELVHFNDSPLIPAAWLARRERLPVVWHLRSALPDGGQDRALGVRPRGDPAGSRRRRSRSRTTSRTSSASARRSSRTPSTSTRFRPGDPRGREGGARPARRPPGRLVLRLHLPVEGLPRVHRGGRAAARPRARRELPDRRRRRPRRGVLPHARRPRRSSSPT